MDNPLNNVKKWFILLNYDPDKRPVKITAKYDMVILDPDFHPDFEIFNERTILIGYASIGEAETYRSYWQEGRKEPWIIEENPNWDENYYVDIRRDAWKRIILDEVIAGIRDKGFDGVFLDTIDVAGMLEADPSGKYAGSKKAMVDIIKGIREKYPDLLLISNNGFSVLDEVAPFIDGVLAEDINMMIDFENNGYMKVQEEDREYKIKILERVKDKYKMPVFVIDYAANGDKKSKKYCVRESLKLGFKPYVAEGALDRLYDQ